MSMASLLMPWPIPGLTRARYMLIIITDLKGMQASQNYHPSVLGETIDYCLKKDLEYELDVTETTPDFDEMMPSAGIDVAAAWTAFRNKTAKHCYKCGDAGHFAKNCDKPKSKNCYACGKEGHSWQECPTDLCCRNCQVTGHTNKDCPSVKRTKQCDNCSLEYHNVRDCPKELAEIIEEQKSEFGGGDLSMRTLSKQKPAASIFPKRSEILPYVQEEEDLTAEQLEELKRRDEELVKTGKFFSKRGLKTKKRDNDPSSTDEFVQPKDDGGAGDGYGDGEGEGEGEGKGEGDGNGGQDASQRVKAGEWDETSGPGSGEKLHA